MQPPKKAPSIQMIKGVEKGKSKGKKASEKPAVTKGKEMLGKKLERMELQKLKKFLNSTKAFDQINKAIRNDKEFFKLFRRIETASKKERAKALGQMMARLDENIMTILLKKFNMKVIEQYLKEAKTESIFRAMVEHQPKDSFKPMLGLAMFSRMLFEHRRGQGMLEMLGIKEPEKLSKEKSEEIKKEIEKAIKHSEKEPKIR